jgi:hypothetical protein
MKNQDILNNINEMKYLFGYRRGKVISEQYINEEGEVQDFVVGGTQSVSVGPTTTLAAASTSTAAASTTTKTTRKATGLEVQKLLNTKYNLGLKEDGVIGPLTRGAIMTALEGGSVASSSSGSASTTASTTVAGSTTATTTVAGATTQTSTAAAAGGGGVDTSKAGGDASALIG